MAADDLPFTLITRPPEDPAQHDHRAPQQRLAQRRLPDFVANHKSAALRYQPSEALLLAINMALHTGSPLLLTGESGTGKTQAADFVGAYFGIPVYKFLVKSTSTAQDLLYEFDAVGYLHWAQTASQQTGPALSPDALSAEAQAVRKGFLRKRALWEAYDTAGDAVVLIDEIDKAPRDFPNDLLHELDQHSFPHPFAARVMVRPQSSRPPIVIITSNEERRLPDAFLRRCIFHRIELTESLVAAAVESMARVGTGAGETGRAAFPHLSQTVREAAQRRFWEIRDLPGIDKKPSTAELLTWLCVLSALRTTAERLSHGSLRELPGIEVLIKDYGDLQRLA